MSHITLSQAVEKAIDGAPFFRRTFLKMRWNFMGPQKREMALEGLREKLHEDVRVKAMGFEGAFNDEEFDVAATEFEFDPDQLREFLDIILEYLPQLIDLISRFFILLPFIAVIAYSISAYAPATAQNRGANNPLARAEALADLPPAPVPQSEEFYQGSTVYRAVPFSSDCGALMAPPASADCGAMMAIENCQPLSMQAAPAVASCDPAPTFETRAVYSSNCLESPPRAAVGRGFAGVQCRSAARPVARPLFQRQGPLRRLFGRIRFGGICR